MIFVDSCVPMYFVGASHPLKQRSIELLHQLISGNEIFVTNAEVFQEILHRYRALQDRDHLNAAYELLEEMVNRVFDITKADTDLARSLGFQYSELSSRDCLHVATLKHQSIRKIWTYDRRFKTVPSIIVIE